MGADLTDDGVVVAQPPADRWSGDLVFGLAAMPLGFLAAFAAVGLVMAAVEASGVRWLGAGGPDADPAVVSGAILGPWLLAGVLTAARVRWWVGPSSGLAVGCILGAALWAVEPGWSHGMAAGVQGGWTAAGLVGGLFAGARRRFRF